ncbi:MAG: DNA polymerase III, subunit gamma and tau, partial [Spirochaetes bacterium GWF1_41_5]
LLAKSLSCEKAPVSEPCNACAYCTGITDGSYLEYHEINGASSRGIDDIRGLNESLNYSASADKPKIFVIDEVHMLTTEAFNALLKSLEEPPPKVFFILCTTEAHKVPLTIRSRCQHYGFRAFSVSLIIERLREILSAENIPYEDEALFYIAKAASGSMRDSQSILDQVISYTGGKVTAQTTGEILGVQRGEVYTGLLRFLADDKKADIFNLMQKLYSDGKDLRQFLHEFTWYLTAINYIKEGISDLAALEISTADYETLKSMQNRFTRDELYTLMDVLLDLFREIKTAANPRVITELYLIKLMRYKTLISAETLREELRKFGAGQEPPAAGAVSAALPVSRVTGLEYNALLQNLKSTDTAGYEILRQCSFTRFSDNTLVLAADSSIRQTVEKARADLVDAIRMQIKKIYNQEILVVFEFTGQDIIHTIKEAFDGEILEDESRGQE